MEPTNDLENKNKNELISMIQELQLENENFQKRLKTYTAPAARREYYERNKELEKARSKEYKERTGYKSTWKPSKEQSREYARRAYQKKKLKNTELKNVLIPDIQSVEEV